MFVFKRAATRLGPSAAYALLLQFTQTGIFETNDLEKFQ